MCPMTYQTLTPVSAEASRQPSRTRIIGVSLAQGGLEAAGILSLFAQQ